MRSSSPTWARSTTTSRRYGLLLAVVVAIGCTERALEIPDDGGNRDLGHDLGRDQSTDLADLAPDLFDLPPPNPCPAGTNFIFTIDEDTTLSRFNPTSHLFFDVGKIGCPASGGATPNSMAIARDGTGWVNYSSGELFHLDTKTAACTATSYTPGQGGLVNFGMSFAQDTPGGVDETLFVADSATGGGTTLAQIDLMTMKLHDPVTLVGGRTPELTGDDAANLWGFFPGDLPPKIARIDKQAGTLDRIFKLPSLSGTPSAWGVAAYQGNFYVFLQRDGEPSTRIYEVDGTTGMISTLIGATGRRIVGVGVATCAGNTGLE